MSPPNDHPKDCKESEERNENPLKDEIDIDELSSGNMESPAVKLAFSTDSPCSGGEEDLYPPAGTGRGGYTLH